MTEGESETLEGDMRGLVCMVTGKKTAPEGRLRLSVEGNMGVCRGWGLLAEDQVLQKRDQEK